MIFASVFLSTNADPTIWAVLGVCGGLYLFYRGFRLLQRKRLIMDTPSSKIRSASMGLVEVSGLACGPYTVTAPITGLPCYYYRTTAWQMQQRGKNREWVKVADEGLHVPFYLDDNTGRVLVNPQGAEMDIHRDFHQEFSNSIFSSDSAAPPSVANFLMSHGVSTDKKIKVDEYCIKPKNALFILGTLAENHGLEVSGTPRRTDLTDSSIHLNLSGAFDGGLADGIGVSSNFRRTVVVKTVKDGVAQEVIRLSDHARPGTALDMTQQAKITAALTKAGITNPAAWEAAGLTGPAAVSVSDGPTSAANTDGFDLHPSTVLMKGTHNPAFFISWRSQKDVLQSLGWKSAAMIWGGPALTLVCVYILLAQSGWL